MERCLISWVHEQALKRQLWATQFFTLKIGWWTSFFFSKCSVLLSIGFLSANDKQICLFFLPCGRLSIFSVIITPRSECVKNLTNQQGKLKENDIINGRFSNQNADGVCEVSWLVSYLVSCENHLCTFMHHYNRFAHFILAHTCILVVQPHLHVHLLFSLTCFHMCLALLSYTSNAQLTHISTI